MPNPHGIPDHDAPGRLVHAVRPGTAAAGPAVDRAMGEGLGSGWRAAIDADMAAGLRRHLPWAGILCRPFPVRPRRVERVANLATATPAGRTCSTCTATAPPGGRPDPRLLPRRGVPQWQQALRLATHPPGP
jgi:hypothetical protein